MASATLTHRDYTVGWICALPEEQTAALAMLDDRHADLPKPQHDDNAYTLGRIGKHNIVIACLPMGLIGNNKSATVAAHMVSTFPLIKFGLMVGIGGGVPPQVRLGDVVVSKPVGEFGGVVQWDFGKAGQGNTFKRVGALNNPPAALLTAITKLQSKYDMDGSEIPNHLEDLKQKWPKLAPQYLKTDRLKDILFKSSYRHIEKNVSGDDDWEYEEEEQESCPYCDHAQVVKRNPAAREMRVHYGLIASGNQVVKDAVRRNEINKMLGGNVLCFEMEAAGLMNDFPCIVVRGICDYADSHKNKNWQKHAAAVAAAFAKEFLHMVPAHEVEEMTTIQNVYETVKDIAGDVNILTQRHHHEEQHAILDWLTAVDYSSQQNDFIRKCQPGTGTWLLGSEAFQRWLTEPDQILFCPGIPGAGKTIATSTVIDYLFQRFQDNSTGIAYIYCNFRQQEEQHLMDLLLSLLKQFAQGHPTIPDCVKSLYDKHKSNRTRPSLTEISGALKSIITGLSKAFIIVDALDECKSTDGIRSQLLLEIFNLQANTKANLFATSRSIPEIEEEFKRKGAVLLEIRASDNDIRRYLDGNTSRLPSFVRENPELEDKVKRAIITAADGMFLLATLHLGSLEDKVNLRQIEDALVKLPKGTDAYSQAYQEAMERIQCQKHGFRDLAFKTLSWISRARRPLAPRELQHALAIVENRPALDEANITKVELIASACAGLVIIDEESNIIRLVHYTTQEYFQETWSVWFPNAETDIAKACITYLSFDNFSTGLCLTNHEFDERLRLNPLYSYAARNWGHHARAASVELEQELITFLENENRVSASSQALMATESSLDYVQRRELYMTGVNLAAYFGLEKVTATLYENGHDPDSKDSGGRTPLAWAAMEGHEMIVKQLLDREGVNPDLKDSGDWTPLLLAAMEGHEKIVRLLLDNDKVNPDSKDQQGLTPLAWAAIEGYEAIVKLLLDNDRVDPDSENWEGATPLSWAAIEGHEAVVKLLLDNDKVDPDSKDWKGTTPLSWAAYRGHEAVVKLLLDNLGVDPDSKDKRGRTPLSFAAWMGHENIVKLLLGHDSDPDTKDGSGRTPVSWAAKEGQEKIVKLLKEHRRISIP